MWTSTQYRQVVRGSAWYDLIVTAAFVTPWSFAVLHGLLTALAWANSPMRMLALKRAIDPGAYSRLYRGGSLNFWSMDDVDFNAVSQCGARQRLV